MCPHSPNLQLNQVILRPPNAGNATQALPLLYIVFSSHPLGLSSCWRCRVCLVVFLSSPLSLSVQRQNQAGHLCDPALATPHDSFFPLHAHLQRSSSPRSPSISRIDQNRIFLFLHDRALGIALLRLSSFLALLDLRDHAFESFSDVFVVAGARFGEAAAQLFGEFLAVGEGDLTLFGAQIGLVADDCEGNGVGAL